MLAGAVEASCAEHRGGTAQTMAEGVAKAYLRAKARQIDASRALYLIATELDGGAMVEAATCRAEPAIKDLLLSATDRHFTDPQLAATILLATISGAVRSLYERGMPPAAGSDVEAELVTLVPVSVRGRGVISRCR